MIECVKYFLINKQSCLGSANIYIPKWGLEIYGIMLHQKDGKRWINFPSRAYETEGVTKYLPYFRFREKSHYEKFCDEVKRAIDKKAEEISPIHIPNEVKKEIEEECPF